MTQYDWITCDSTLGGITHGVGIDLEGSVGHHLTSEADQDLIGAQVVWDVGHGEGSVTIVNDVGVGIGTVGSLWKVSKKYDWLLEQRMDSEIWLVTGTKNGLRCRFHLFLEINEELSMIA